MGAGGGSVTFSLVSLSCWAVAYVPTQRMLLLGSRAQQLGGYASSEHPEIIHVLIGMIFAKEIRNNFWSAVPWSLCCLGLQQNAWLCSWRVPVLLLFPQAVTELAFVLFLRGSWSASELIHSIFFYFHSSLLSAVGREGILFIYF